MIDLEEWEKFKDEFVVEETGLAQKTYEELVRQLIFVGTVFFSALLVIAGFAIESKNHYPAYTYICLITACILLVVSLLLGLLQIVVDLLFHKSWLKRSTKYKSLSMFMIDFRRGPNEASNIGIVSQGVTLILGAVSLVVVAISMVTSRLC